MHTLEEGPSEKNMHLFSCFCIFSQYFVNCFGNMCTCQVQCANKEIYPKAKYLSRVHVHPILLYIWKLRILFCKALLTTCIFKEAVSETKLGLVQAVFQVL